MDKKKLSFVIGGVAAALVVIILIFCFVLSGNSRDYQKNYDEAEMAFLQGDYELAIKKLEKAIDIDPTEECYLLMAESYYAQDDIDMAIQVLYLGYSRVGGDTISLRLEELKAENKENNSSSGDVEVTPNGNLSIGGKELSPDTKSLLLSGKGLSDGDIAPLAQLSQLESLSLANNSLTDISVLSQLQGLNFLQIDGNSISDISPLASLTGLKTLYIDGNPIEDFTPLHGLNALRTLSMKGVNITESQMKALQEALPDCKIYADQIEEEVIEITLGGKTFTSDVTELDLRGLGITDISALSDCTELVKLDLRDNSVSDVSALVDLQKLEYLNLWNNKVEDLSPLMTLVHLNYLDADNNKLTNISFLEYLPEMEELWLSGNDIKDISVLEKLPLLRRLGLKNTGLTDEDLELLSGITTLTELSIKDNEELSGNAVDALKQALPGCTVTHSENLLYVVKFGDAEFRSDALTLSAVDKSVGDISELARFTELNTLVLTTNKIGDISALSGLTKLEVLELSKNSVSDISALSGLTKLRSLGLLSNSISNISALSGLTALTELHLSFNAIGDISPLAGLTALLDLDLDGNVIRDISPLAGLSSLKNLSLENNLITDLSPLYGLKNLETLYIRGNSELEYEDVLALQQALPNCIITCDFDLENGPAEEEDDPADGGQGFPMIPAN